MELTLPVVPFGVKLSIIASGSHRRAGSQNGRPKLDFPADAESRLAQLTFS